MSVNGVKGMVEGFIASGWCRMHGDNLVFNKLKVFDHNKTKALINFKIANNVKQILNDLYLLILRQKQYQFERYKKLKSDLKSSQLRTYKKAQKKLKSLGMREKDLPGESSMFKISIGKIAELLGLSVGSASNFIKELRKKGLIWCKTNRVAMPIGVGDKIGQRAALSYGESRYYYKGLIFQVSCNEYNFNRK